MISPRVTEKRAPPPSRSPASRRPEKGGHVSGPNRQVWGLVAGSDLEAFAILRDRRIALRAGFQGAEATQGAPERMAANVVERPHVLFIEAQVGLRHQRLAVTADEAEVLDGVRDIPSVVAILPLAAAAELAHRGRWAPFVFGGESHLVGPTAAFRTIGVHLAVDFIAAEVLADQTGDHAAPAAM